MVDNMRAMESLQTMASSVEAYVCLLLHTVRNAS